VNGKGEWNVDMVSMYGQVEIIMKENGLMMREMEMAQCIGQLQMRNI